MFCLWCEMGTIPKSLRKKGMVWIHEDCLMKLSDFRSTFEGVKEILSGKRNETIESFIVRMDEFDKNWEKIQKIISGYGLK